MRWTAGASFGGTYAPTTYHIRDPDVSKKFSTFGPKLMMPSTYHPTSSFQTTATTPRRLLSVDVSSMAYPAPCHACIPSVSFIYCSMTTSTLPCFRSRIASYRPPSLPDLIFSVARLILFDLLETLTPRLTRFRTPPPPILTQKSPT